MARAPQRPVSRRTAMAEIARGEDAHAIEAATKALADGTEHFAALRMNRGIQQALTGRRLDEV